MIRKLNIIQRNRHFPGMHFRRRLGGGTLLVECRGGELFGSRSGRNRNWNLLPVCRSLHYVFKLFLGHF